MDAKTAARQHLAERAETLIALSHRIHAHPELAFEEHRASTWLCEFLDRGGLSVTRGAFDLPTAFVARAGHGPVHIAICAEYDALPTIGHACGHNMIAAMAAGAGLAAAPLADDVGLTIHIVGTPAEEAGGGKIRLLERGAFTGMHAAMMVHPAPFDVLEPPMLAYADFDVHYHGKAAHAAAFPDRGVNAADALVVAQTAIGLLRQHLEPDQRIHGIVTCGGEAPNIVPAHTSGRWAARARTLADIDRLRARLHRCFEAGALATGCTLRIEETSPPYAEVVHDRTIAAAYRRNAEALGRRFLAPTPELARFAASTDMGNVSQVVPSIHPTIGLDCFPAVNHQPEFAAACITAAADRATLDGALAMAWTAIDLATDGALRSHLLEGPARTPARD
jgi:amidohydrolase